MAADHAMEARWGISKNVSDNGSHADAAVELLDLRRRMS